MSGAGSGERGVRGCILVTRPEHEAGEFASDLRALGFLPLISPVLRIVPVEYERQDMAAYDALIFTSASAVEHFQRLADAEIEVYAVGSATAKRAREAGLKNVCEAGGAGRDLAALLAARFSGQGAKVLHARGRDIAFDLSEALKPEQIEVDFLIVYEAISAGTLSLEAVSALREGRVDAVTLFSVRTAKIFMELLRASGLLPVMRSIKVLCISQSVLECVQSELGSGEGVPAGAQVYVSEAPDRGSMLWLADGLFHQ